MGNCVSIIKRKKDPSKAITLAIIGVDNVGKTTLCSAFTGEAQDLDVAPTVGFRNVKFTESNFNITMFDLGGGKNIRPIWKNYFGEVYGVVYVIDSSSSSNLREAKEVLHDTLDHPQISGKPVLILANKVDKDDHMEEVDIVNGLRLKQSVNANSCPSKLVMVSALKGIGSQMDKELQTGLKWLLENIRGSLSILETRVREDMRLAMEVRDREREERRVRVKKQREEREKEEENERQRLGLSMVKGDSDDDIVDGGDPFKTLDVAMLTQKELSLREEKRRKKQLIKEFESNSATMGQTPDDSVVSSADFHIRNGHSKTLERYNLDMGDHPSIRMDSGDNGYAALNLFSRKSRGSALPPLESLGTNSQESVLGIGDKKRGKKKKRLTDYHLDREGNGYDYDEQSGITGRLGLSMQEPNSWHRDMGEHELTPRVAKPKKNRTVKVERISEDEEEDDIHKEIQILEKDRYNIAEIRGGSYKRNKYDDVYPTRHQNRDTGRYLNRIDSEQDASLDKNSTRKTSQPNLSRFEEEEDEGIDDDSDNVIDDGGVDSYKAMRNTRNHNLNRAQKQTKKHQHVLSDEEQDEYLSHNILKDTMHFPTSPTDEEEVPMDFHKEMEKLQLRKDQDVRKGHKGLVNGGYTGREGKKSFDDDDVIDRYIIKGSHSYKSNVRSHDKDDDDDEHLNKTADTINHRRKKKKNYLLRSNKLVPSDEEEVEPQGSYRFNSPRMVQEHGSQNNSDTETSTKSRHSQQTHFHSNMPRDSDSDFSTKWGLAEDLPSIDDGNMRRMRYPNIDDSDGDVIF